MLKSTVWKCVSRVFKKSSGIDCPARTIYEEDLQAAVVTVEFKSGLKIDVAIERKKKVNTLPEWPEIKLYY